LNVRQLLNVAYQLEPREKKAVFKMIGKRATEDLVPDLISRTGGRDNASRALIIELLSKFNLPEVQHTFEELLGDDNRQIRATAMESLGKLDLPQNIALIASKLLDGDLEVQGKAVELLIQLNDPETCKYLVDVLRDESEYTRRSAVEVLNEIADPSSIKYLLKVLGDSDWWVRSRACDALANIGGEKVLSNVMELIRDKDENIRRSAIEILNQTKDENSVEHLLQATEDSDWWVCERAVDALGEIGDVLAIPRLKEMLGENPKGLPSVVRALGKLGDAEVVPQIIEAMQSPEPETVTECIQALSTLLDDSNFAAVRASLQPLLKASNETVSQAAVQAMEAINIRFSPSMIQGNAQVASAAEAAQTLLVDDAELRKLTEQTAPQPELPIDITELKSGDLIENRYKYIEKIGKGAFGTVILVEDTVVNEQLILKFLNANISTDEEMLQRFVHELRFSRKITHHNVIRIYDFLKLGGSYAISMEYFPSHTLGAEVVDKQPLPFDKASGFAIDIATGMAVAHKVGIVHRDLKPANVLIDDDGLLKIVDFGVAAAAGGSDDNLTKDGYVIGSPKYMSPEQIVGKQVDHRADIYSLGIMLYEMLTGTPPYTKGDHMAVMYQHVQGKCQRCDEVNPALPKPLADIVHKALELDKQNRFDSMDDFRKAILSTMALEEA
jgi:serine/threonine-protein kinase